MNYTELVKLFFERSNALQWYWTLYVVIAGGLLAFSSLRQKRDLITGILVTILFCFFAYKNLGGIRDTTLQRQATLEAIHQYPRSVSGEPDNWRERSLIEPTLSVPDYEDVRNFHIASDILVVAAMWAMELRRIRMARSEAAK